MREQGCTKYIVKIKLRDKFAIVNELILNTGVLISP